MKNKKAIPDKNSVSPFLFCTNILYASDAVLHVGANSFAQRRMCKQMRKKEPREYAGLHKLLSIPAGRLGMEESQESGEVLSLPGDAERG